MVAIIIYFTFSVLNVGKKGIVELVITNKFNLKKFSQKIYIRLTYKIKKF